MLSNDKEKKNRFFNFTPVRILALGFASVILIGAILLSLPIAAADGNPTPFIDSLFVSTSATCVTGLTTVDTGTHWSLFGQIVIILLIQIGGLGFMTFASFFVVMLGKKISLKERLVMQEAYNAFNIQGIVRLMLAILGITLTIEGIGGILLSTQFVRDYGGAKGIYFGFWHSVSSFCNAGFDLIGGFKSITGYAENPVIILTIGGLIVLGGLGFAVISEVIHVRNFGRLTLHSKIVLFVTTVLIFGGAMLFFIFEYSNPATMGHQSLMGKVLSSIFASITPRTAGYNSISTTDMTMAGKFLTVILMFIGASPGSTGGGIKTTTATLIFLTIMAVIRGRDEAEIFNKRINKALIYRAIAITFISFALVVIVTMVLTITQGEEFSFITYLYEATSAFGTVGLTLGLTPSLTTIGKVAVLLTMYAGRVGPLTLALAFAHRQHLSSAGIKYPEDKIMVG